MFADFDLSEVRSLAGALASAGKDINTRASAVLRKTALDIEADAKILAPVDTGALRSSISTTFSGSPGRGGMTAVVSATTDYAVFVELGTSTQPGQPFLGPAFDRRTPAFETALLQLADTLLS